MIFIFYISSICNLAMEVDPEASKVEVVHEGKAKITFNHPNEVFYNPVQVFNRDLSVACIQVYIEELFPLTVKFKKKLKPKQSERNDKERHISGDQSSDRNEQSAGSEFCS